MKRKVLASLLLLTVLSGCSFTQTSIDSLIKPPTMSKEQEEIYEALRGDIESNKNINLIYPKAGEFRSPYILTNLDEESTDEALVFYRLNNSATTSATALNINVLDQKNDKWRSVWVNKEQNVSEIDKVSITDIGSRKAIIIGYRMLSDSLTTRDAIEQSIDPLNTMMFNIFTFDDGQLNQLRSVRCMAYEVYDLDGDGTQEIIAIRKLIDEQTRKDSIVASVYRYQGGMFQETQSVAMNVATTEYLALHKGSFVDGSPAIYADGTQGSDSYTEILTLDSEGVLTNYCDDKTLYQSTARLAGIASMDLDGDGVFEIPKNNGFPGYDNNQFYRILWQDYEDEKLVAVQNTYTDYTADYYFTLPERWGEKITARKDTVNNEVTFYVYQNSDLKDESQKLLKIRTFTSSGLEKGKLPVGYEYLSENGQFIYAYTLYQTKTNDDLTIEEVQNAFHVIEQ